MIESLILIEGQGVNAETLSISLMNAKHLVIGRSPMGMIVHVAANSLDDLGNTLLKFGQVPAVSRVLTLVLQIQQ